MTRSLQAVYEQGVLRPLEEADWLDATFLRFLESQADDSVTLEQVRSALAKIPRSMVEDFRRERDERS